jgi:hypothetical protein
MVNAKGLVAQILSSAKIPIFSKIIGEWALHRQDRIFGKDRCPLKQGLPAGKSQLRPAIAVAGKRGVLLILLLYACDSFPRHNRVRRQKIGISLAGFISRRS